MFDKTVTWDYLLRRTESKIVHPLIRYYERHLTEVHEASLMPKLFPHTCRNVILTLAGWLSRWHVHLSTA